MPSKVMGMLSVVTAGPEALLALGGSLPSQASLLEEGNPTPDILQGTGKCEHSGNLRHRWERSEQILPGCLPLLQILAYLDTEKEG